VSPRAVLCRWWLERNDPEARGFWRSLPPDADFAGTVADNLRDFGPDETGRAEIALTARTSPAKETDRG